MSLGQGLQELSTINRQGSNGSDSGPLKLSSLKWLLLFFVPLLLLVLYTRY